MNAYSRTYNIPAGTTAKQLCSSNPNRKRLYVVNNGTGTVYILSSQNLSASDGIPVYVNGYYLDKESTCEFWIIAESGTQDVRVMVVD